MILYATLYCWLSNERVIDDTGLKDHTLYKTSNIDCDSPSTGFLKQSLNGSKDYSKWELIHLL